MLFCNYFPGAVVWTRNLTDLKINLWTGLDEVVSEVAEDLNQWHKKYFPVLYHKIIN